MRGQRFVHQYDPARDLAERWPEWSVYETSDLPAGKERFHVDCKVVLINSSACGSDWARAHVAAHLHLEHDHDHDRSGGFTLQQEADARDLASIWMDYARWEHDLPFLEQHQLHVTTTAPAAEEHDAFESIPPDGEPTQRL